MFLCETEWQESKNGISSEKKKKKNQETISFSCVKLSEKNTSG